MNMNWIPTSKALPEARGNYLVTLMIKSKTDPDLDYSFVTINHYNGNGIWTESNSSNKKVLAWMNLPDVYEIYER